MDRLIFATCGQVPIKYTAGIGITTFNRPMNLELCKEQIIKNTKLTDFNAIAYIADDSNERKGITYRKNECLKALKDCDYIFLFDDDCFPIREGWIDFFVKAYQITKNHHFLYLKDTTSIKRQFSETICEDSDFETNINESCVSIDSYNNAGGAFMFLTKKVLEKIGGFNPSYGIYGFEHAGYSRRIYKSGLNKYEFLTIRGIEEYIYAMDYDFHLPFNKKVNHEPSLKKEFHKLESYLQENKKIYDADFQIYQPL